MKSKYNNMTKTELLKKIEELEANKDKYPANYEKEQLIQNLQQKDIQIEIQKFELIEKQNQLEESRDKYADLYDFAPAGYIILDDKILIKEINLTGLDMLGTDRRITLNIPFINFFIKEDIHRFLNFIQNCRNNPVHQSEEFIIRKKDNNILNVLITAVSFHDYTTNNTHFRISLNDITEKKKVEKSFHESEERFRLIADAAPVMIWMTDIQNNIIYLNKAILTFLGKNQEEIQNKGIFLLIHPEDRDKVQKEYFKAFKEYTGFTLEFRIKNNKNEYRWLLDTASPRLLTDGTFVGFIGSGIDITDRKNTSLKLKQSHKEKEIVLKELEDFKYAVDQSSIVAITDQKGIIKHANDYFCKISKYSREELIGQDHRIINSGYHSKEFIKNLWKTIGNGNIWRGELRNKAKDGSIYWVDTTIVPFLNEQGKPYQHVAIRSDITEKQESRIKLEKSLKEKEVLLKEIHHRVKNNLQVINSLLSLQKSYISDPGILEIFRSSQNRVVAMAVLHEKLYGTDNLADIDFRDYINTISQSLLENYKNSSDIKIVVDVDEVQFDLDTSINFGLIINELVSNSLKYAFRGKKNGKIYISLRYIEKDKQLILKVADDGVGLPEDFSEKRKKSLGLELVTSIVEQLNGKLEISNNGNTIFQITVNGDGNIFSAL